MAREGSKRAVAIEIMNANANKSMAEVLELISQANGIDNGAARSYYVYLVKNGMAKGQIETKADKAPKAKAVKRAAKEVVAKAVKAVKSETPAKSAAEIEKIKAANLARMKQVLGKVKQNVKTDEVPFAETDAFASPAFLSKDEVNALV